jgi:hypothetical protein
MRRILATSNDRCRICDKAAACDLALATSFSRLRLFARDEEQLVELQKESVEGGIAVYGSAGSQTIQTVSLENGVTFQRVCAVTLRIGR